jgi:two-component system, response regulator PdtaR
MKGPHERSRWGEMVTNGTNAMVIGLIRIAEYARDRPMGAEGGEQVRLGQAARIKHAVLVVEDEVLVRLMMAEELRSAGYEVIEAATADEALDALAHIPGVSLVITDIRMPGSMDGLRLARLVRSEYPATRILLTSGNFPNVAIDHDGFFLKPYDPRKMIHHIKTLLD